MTRETSVRDGAALEWFKSSYSSNDGPACVEVAAVPNAVRIRDSKNTRGPQLGFPPDVWADFIAYTSSG